MNKALAGLVVALTLGVGLAVGVLAGGIISPDATPAPVAVASTSPSPSPTESHALAEPPAQPRPRRRLTPSPTAPPSPTPEPTPSLVPAPLTGRLVKPEVASRHVIAVMIDDQFAARPQSGLSSADVVWQAPAEGGIPRYMALFQTGSPKAVGPGPQLALLLHRLGLGVALGLRPRGRVAAGAGAAPLVEGQGPGRVRRGRVPVRGPLPVADQHPVRPAQRVHGRQEPPDDGQEGRREGGRLQVALEVRPGQAPRRCGRRAARSSSRTSPTGSPTSTTARRTRTCGR